MSGVIIQQRNVRHQDVVNFDNYGEVTNAHLKYGNVSSVHSGYKVMSASEIGAITIVVSEAVAGSVDFIIEKNAVTLFTSTVLIGQTGYNNTFTPGDYPIASLDEISVRIVGTCKNPVVQLKIM